MDRGDLGELADPSKFHEPIDTTGFDAGDLKRYLTSMLSIRLVEQHLADMRREGQIGGPVHLGVGQEAVAVGVSAILRTSDRVFGAHRSHSHILALGSSIHGLFAEVLGKDSGLSRGMGGSMHLWDQPRGFYGSVPIVGGTVSLAVGAALAAKQTGTGDVAVVYLGDGAVEEGVFHESLNLAAILKVPVLFAVENNLFASHMHISLRQPRASVSRFAAAHDMLFEVVDGNDVCAVQRAARRLVEHARSGRGPGFLEAVTARWYGHVDWREDVDVGIQRSMSDLANWRRRDPIARLAAGMASVGTWTEAEQQDLSESIQQQIRLDWARAQQDPYPPPSALLDRVYAAGKVS